MIGVDGTPPAIGVDVVDYRDLQRLVERSWFLQYGYARQEIRDADIMGEERRLEFLAGRFAAKEAVLKALGKGVLQDIPPCEVCIEHRKNGSLVVRFLGRTAEREISPVTLSIAHKRDVATAVAISPALYKEASTSDGNIGEPTTSAMYCPENDDKETKALLRVRIGHEETHYGGEIVDGARILKLFGDLVTEITIRTDGDEGLLAEYSRVRFTAPVHPGDYIEATARLVHKTMLRRVVELQAHKIIAAQPETCPSSARLLEEPQLVCSATATTVVPTSKVAAATKENR